MMHRMLHGDVGLNTRGPDDRLVRAFVHFPELRALGPNVYSQHFIGSGAHWLSAVCYKETLRDEGGKQARG
jgi:hypothetical protein